MHNLGGLMNVTLRHPYYNTVHRANSSASGKLTNFRKDRGKNNDSSD